MPCTARQGSLWHEVPLRAPLLPQAPLEVRGMGAGLAYTRLPSFPQRACEFKLFVVGVPTAAGTALLVPPSIATEHLHTPPTSTDSVSPTHHQTPQPEQAARGVQLPEYSLHPSLPIPGISPLQRLVEDPHGQNILPAVLPVLPPMHGAARRVSILGGHSSDFNVGQPPQPPRPAQQARGREELWLEV